MGAAEDSKGVGSKAAEAFRVAEDSKAAEGSKAAEAFRVVALAEAFRVAEDSKAADLAVDFKVVGLEEAGSAAVGLVVAWVGEE